VPAGTTLDAASLDRLVAASKPAHVPHRLELITEDA
jgi:hypothetical protein